MRVIAEAYGREPLDRTMIGHENGLCYLVAQDTQDEGAAEGARGVGFPERYVFAFNQQLFFDLRRAFESGDSNRLESLWSEAHPALESA